MLKTEHRWREDWERKGKSRVQGKGERKREGRGVHVHERTCMQLTFYDDKYSDFGRLPLVLHVQYTRKLQGQQECLVKLVNGANLERPHIDVALVFVAPIAAKTLKTNDGTKSSPYNMLYIYLTAIQLSNAFFCTHAVNVCTLHVHQNTIVHNYTLYMYVHPLTVS